MVDCLDVSACGGLESCPGSKQASRSMSAAHDPLKVGGDRYVYIM